jgi:hypothetical protein
MAMRWVGKLGCLVVSGALSRLLSPKLKSYRSVKSALSAISRTCEYRLTERDTKSINEADAARKTLKF